MKNFGFFLALSFAVAVTMTSCKDANEVAPQASKVDSVAIYRAILAKKGEFAKVSSAALKADATTTEPVKLAAFEIANAAASETRKLMAWNDISGAIGVAAILPKDTTEFKRLVGGANLSHMAQASLAKTGGKNGVDEYVYTRWLDDNQSLVYYWTFFNLPDPQKDYILLKIVRSEVNKSSSGKDLQVTNLEATIQFFWEAAGTPPVVVVPPVVVPPVGNVAKGINVTADSAKVDNNYVKNNLRDGSADGHYGVWQGVSKTIAPLFGLKESDMIAPVPTREYNSAFDGVNYFKFRAAFGISNNGGYGVTDGETQAALKGLNWTEFTVSGAKAFKATSGKYTLKAIYTNNLVTYEAYGIKFGKYKTLIFVLEENGEPIHFSVGGWNK